MTTEKYNRAIAIKNEIEREECFIDKAKSVRVEFEKEYPKLAEEYRQKLIDAANIKIHALDEEFKKL